MFNTLKSLIANEMNVDRGCLPAINKQQRNW